LVIDGNYILEIIPEEKREFFSKENVYIRGISEDSPHPIFLLKDSVVLPDSCLEPLTIENWHTKFHNYSCGEILKFADHFDSHIDYPCKSKSKIKITLYYPKKGMEKMYNYFDIHNCEYREDGSEPRIVINMAYIKEILKSNKVPRATPIRLKVQFVPKVQKQKKT
jgi:hypothetical protein